MKRKTNLFYTSGPDSKFITFSNYTESLTGNFLSTNTKLFPSKFLCLKINNLNNKNKECLIKYLVEYYESKLAVLRDNIDILDYKISPLNYLFEALCKIESINDDCITISNKKLTEIKEQKCFSIQYISDITEQDYNGTYTDTICIINLNNVVSGNLIFKNIIQNIKKVEIDIPTYVNNIYPSTTTPGITSPNISTTTPGITSPNISTTTPGIKYNKCLYGWENGIINEYKNNKSLFDEELNNKGIYYVDSIINYLKYNINNNITKIEFNVIIPLFDLVDINYKSNITNVCDDVFYINNEEYKGLDLKISENNNLYVKNIPLGMWISGDKLIEINKDIDSGFSENWSLTISSQFKPFPYSKSMPNEINNSILSNSFSTFSQILCRQNNIINSFNKVLNNIQNINDRLLKIESQMKNYNSTASYDSLHKEILKFEKEMNSNLELAKNEIYSYLDNLKWKSTI